MLKLPLIHFNIVELHGGPSMEVFLLSADHPIPIRRPSRLDRLHKLSWEKNAHGPRITRHATYWALWESRDEMGLPELDGVHIPDYLAWYNQMNFSIIKYNKPTVDPPVKFAEDTTIIPLV